MRQSFQQKADPSQGADRLARLRARLAGDGVDGFLVPRADEHQGEYVPPQAERLSWLTGFTGSAGLCVVLPEIAAVFADGRYTLQVRDQVDLSAYTPISSVTTQPDDWLAETLTAGQRLGFDPWLHTPADVRKLEAACAKAGATLVPLEPNPLDMVWTDQPDRPVAPAKPYDTALAGRTSEDKRTMIGADIAKGGSDAVVISLPDCIAWLFNMRGGDVPYTPFALSFAVLHSDGHADLFIDERKVDDTLRQHLGNAVTLYPPDALGERLDALGTDGQRVRIDPAWAPSWVERRLAAAGATLVHGDDPVLMPKACKNAAEISGARIAHERDGVAYARFLAWLTAEAPKGTLDEIAVVTALEAFREETGALQDISFDTISGAGPNGAHCHYRVTDGTNRRIEPGSLYLVDSGAQYLEGTTDITRTIAVGTPTDEMRDRFTRVLKGMIALTCARFPEGTKGVQLDALARQYLWAAGCDYDHGTGHGVGAYLSVHEGPQNISKNLKPVDLRPGMILSNEPGFYKTGEFGIRTENLIVVTEPEALPGGDRPVMGFETLTLAPIDRTLIDTHLMSPAELDWLNAYHARVHDVIGPQLDPDSRVWLEAATAPI